MKHELIEDGDFKYISAGEGEPIIVLHGLFGALSNFQDVIDRFESSHRILIPVLPIYDLPLLKTNVKNLAKFLEKFVDHVKIDKALFLGNSLGGHVGLVYANDNPERVKGLILTGSSGLYENAFGGSFPRREDKNFLREKIAITFYNEDLVTDELVDECHEAVNNRNKVIRILSIAKAAIRHNMREDLPNYKMPVCLIWGKNDAITPPAVAEEFHEKMPNASLYWIDKCGHAPMMEHPQKFNDLLNIWIKETFQ